MPQGPSVLTHSKAFFPPPNASLDHTVKMLKAFSVWGKILYSPICALQKLSHCSRDSKIHFLQILCHLSRSSLSVLAAGCLKALMVGKTELKLCYFGTWKVFVSNCFAALFSELLLSTIVIQYFTMCRLWVYGSTTKTLCRRSAMEKDFQIILALLFKNTTSYPAHI